MIEDSEIFSPTGSQKRSSPANDSSGSGRMRSDKSEDDTSQDKTMLALKGVEGEEGGDDVEYARSVRCNFAASSSDEKELAENEVIIALSQPTGQTLSTSILSSPPSSQSLTKPLPFSTALNGPFPIYHPYRGRIAPTPSGHLHVGHAQTFSIASARAKLHNGIIIMRIEDIDVQRCKPHFLSDMLEDLGWLNIKWDYGPTNNKDVATIEDKYEHSYFQSRRLDIYRDHFERLLQAGYIYPSPHSRKDVESALSAPHPEEEGAEAIFPIALRPPYMESIYDHENNTNIDHTYLRIGIASHVLVQSSCKLKSNTHVPSDVISKYSITTSTKPLSGMNWRFRVPENLEIIFYDDNFGEKRYLSGVDFGDFLVWRLDGYPSYELAVVVDDAEMRVSEIVRGSDLLQSTARQILLYVALGLEDLIPQFHHAILVRDSTGRRLAKRDKATSIRQLRAQSPDISPYDIQQSFFDKSVLERYSQYI